MCFKWYILGKKEYEAKRRAIEEEREQFSGDIEWEQWKNDLEKMSAKCAIDNLTRTIQINEIYKEIIGEYGGSIELDIEIAKLKTEKKYKERLYRERYGD